MTGRPGPGPGSEPRPMPGVQRLARQLIRLACLRLPAQARDDRYREWTAELYSIVHDPGTPSRVRRGARAVLYAADQVRGAGCLGRAAPSRSRRRGARKFLQPRTSGAQALVVTVLMAGFLTGDWLLTRSWDGFRTTSAISAVTYGTTMIQLRREACRRRRINDCGPSPGSEHG
jgi:hypothetical protein